MKLDEIKELIGVFSASGLTCLELDTDEARIRLEKNALAAPAAVPGVPAAPQTETETIPKRADEGLVVVKAPLVGMYYRSPSPNAPPIAAEGQTVKKGDALCLIEAMKMINEVPSPVDGTIERLLVENDTLVTFDQPLVVIRRR